MAERRPSRKIGRREFLYGTSLLATSGLATACTSGFDPFTQIGRVLKIGNQDGSASVVVVDKEGQYGITAAHVEGGCGFTPDRQLYVDKDPAYPTEEISVDCWNDVTIVRINNLDFIYKFLASVNGNLDFKEGPLSPGERLKIIGYSAHGSLDENQRPQPDKNREPGFRVWDGRFVGYEHWESFRFPWPLYDNTQELIVAAFKRPEGSLGLGLSGGGMFTALNEYAASINVWARSRDPNGWPPLIARRFGLEPDDELLFGTRAEIVKKKLEQQGII